ncbi:MAG: AAA family ATPase [Gammaproteobacteria bacterium]|nr:AAA family ATPase [Gammaproteobacteria bacterium]MBU1655409.1 AAA family ATPase [Gammaproteobacteria bacterium]MBU1960817.1 AAA family ATPase [Gammaproteobacteria bacterium]
MRRRFKTPSQGIEPIVRLWLLRMLVPLEAHRGFVDSDELHSDALAREIGLGDWVDGSKAFDYDGIRAELRQRHQEAEDDQANAPLPPILRKNIERFAKLVGLSVADRQILAFAVFIHSEEMLDDVGGWLGGLSTLKLCQVLAVLLDLTKKAVEAALAPQGALASAGLVKLDRDGSLGLRGMLDLLSSSFAEQMLNSDADPVELMRETLVPCSPGLLSLADFGHIAPSLKILRPLLKQAMTTKRKGVNIYLHGEPGTGKNELAKALAQELGSELFEVASQNGDGDPIKGEQRLCAFRAAQSVLSRRRAIVLFDEAEDVFNDGHLFARSTAQTRKAWVNRMLEDNPAPAFWLSNTVGGLDPAFIRRFDMVIKLPVPPRTQREQILRAACGDLVPGSVLTRIAEEEKLAPAVVARAASILHLIRDGLEEITPSAAFERLISNTLEAQGHGPLRLGDPNRLPEIYDTAFLHTDLDLAPVNEGLLRSREGRLCLYGPPGTGKTAYGRWLAERLGMPLRVERASDLLSMWVSGSEKNIARAFQEAGQDGALLLIDELDSFLQDRRQAQRGWEVSLVNEMLTQMEAYPGVFIASTNLMDGLDPAALRRFDLKIKFGFLRPGQATELLRRHCQELALPAPDPEETTRLQRLANLTPGDFAAVRRQHRFRPLENPAGLIAALEAECTLKEGARPAIGFVH